MKEIQTALYFLLLAFLLIGLLANFTNALPKIPGDIYIDKDGFKLYIPFTSALVLSIILTLLLNFFLT